MRKCTSMSNHTLDVEKAASPLLGKAAFSCSTDLWLIIQNPLFSSTLPQVIVIIYNLLTKMHYFCGGLAKDPAALVVQTEGQKKALKERGEASA